MVPSTVHPATKTELLILAAITIAVPLFVLLF